MLDPRGVVAWKHSGSNRVALKDDTKLERYKVRTWRLCGETEKEYVHKIKKMRQDSQGADPNDLPDDVEPARADEVVCLRWNLHFHVTRADIIFTTAV